MTTKETRLLDIFRSELLASEARMLEKFATDRVQEPWSGIIMEMKNNQKAMNDRFTQHLDNEEVSHKELFEEIKNINIKIDPTLENLRTMGTIKKWGLALLGFLIVIAAGGTALKTITNWFK